MMNFFKTLLIGTLTTFTIVSVPTPSFADAVIFSGSDVKTLKPNINLNGNTKILSGSVDPTSSATSAPIGSMYMNTVNGNLYKKQDAGSSTNWVKLSSGADSGVNYITNPNAEQATTGWTTYADAAQNIPVDATGGSPSSTWTRVTSSPLRGVGSFLWTRSANNRQGEGVSTPFTIDSADQSRQLSLSFDYKVVSGTFVAADGTTAPLNDGTTSQNAGMSDLGVFVYDVTNSVLIPVSPQVLTSTSSTSASFKGTFQAASNSTSYRLAIHTSRSTAVAFTAQFDNFYVGPLNGGANGVKAPTIQTFTSGTSATYTTPTSPYPSFIRVRIVGAGGGGGGGDNVSGGAGGGGGGSGGYVEKIITNPAATYTYTVGGGTSGGSAGNPGGGGNNGGATSFSTLSAGGGSGGGGAVGITGPGLGGAGGTASGGDLNYVGEAGDNGAPGISGVVQGLGGSGGSTPLGSGGKGSAGNATGGTGNNYGGGAGGGSGSGGTSAGGYIEVTEYYLANSSTSSDGDGRLVAARTTGATATVTSSFSDVTWTTVVSDTHSSMGAINYTIPISGFYDFSGQLNMAYASVSAGNISKVQLFNTTTSTALFITYFNHQSTNVQDISIPFNYQNVFFTAGTQVKVQVASTSTSPTVLSSATLNFLGIKRVSAPSSIQPGESVAARFYNSALNHSIGTSLTTLIGDTKSFDTHNALTASTGLFSVPISGKYRVSFFASSNTTGASADVISWGLIKNGSAVTGYGGVLLQVTSTGMQAGFIGGDTIQLLAGDTIGVQFKETVGAYTLNQQESVTFERVGN